MTGTTPLSTLNPTPSSGLLVPGNINLYNRPEIPNPNGGTSTVYSTSFTDENPKSPYFGKEVLVPKAVGNRILTDDEAKRNYQITGQHMGVFADPDSATAYAQQVHNDYAAGKYGFTGAPPSGSGITPQVGSLSDLLYGLLRR